MSAKLPPAFLPSPQVAERCCVDCDSLAPNTETAHTLISSQHGWRLTLREEQGRRVSEWRCPSCWVRFKARRH